MNCLWRRRRWIYHCNESHQLEKVTNGEAREGTRRWELNVSLTLYWALFQEVFLSWTANFSLLTSEIVRPIKISKARFSSREIAKTTYVLCFPPSSSYCLAHPFSSRASPFSSCPFSIRPVQQKKQLLQLIPGLHPHRPTRRIRIRFRKLTRRARQTILQRVEKGLSFEGIVLLFHQATISRNQASTRRWRRWGGGRSLFKRVFSHLFPQLHPLDRNGRNPHPWPTDEPKSELWWPNILHGRWWMSANRDEWIEVDFNIKTPDEISKVKWSNWSSYIFLPRFGSILPSSLRQLCWRTNGNDLCQRSSYLIESTIRSGNHCYFPPISFSKFRRQMPTFFSLSVHPSIPKGLGLRSELTFEKAKWRTRKHNGLFLEPFTMRSFPNFERSLIEPSSPTRSKIKIWMGILCS